MSERTAEPGIADAAPSPRELEVLGCLVMGRSNKEIGDALFITEQTVKNHMTAVPAPAGGWRPGCRAVLRGCEGVGGDRAIAAR